MLDQQIEEPDIPPSIMNALLATWRESGDARRLPVIGASMWPLLRAGDYIAVDPGINAIKRGHVIVFNTPNVLVVHRVMDIRFQDGNAIYFAKGDNRRNRDMPVDQSMILGIVTHREREEQSTAIDSISSRFIGYWLRRHAWIVRGIGRRAYRAVKRT